MQGGFLRLALKIINFKIKINSKKAPKIIRDFFTKKG